MQGRIQLKTARGHDFFALERDIERWVEVSGKHEGSTSEPESNAFNWLIIRPPRSARSLIIHTEQDTPCLRAQVPVVRSEKQSQLRSALYQRKLPQVCRRFKEQHGHQRERSLRNGMPSGQVRRTQGICISCYAEVLVPGTRTKSRCVCESESTSSKAEQVIWVKSCLRQSESPSGSVREIAALWHRSRYPFLMRCVGSSLKRKLLVTEV